MNRIHFFLGLITSVLLLSACQSSQNNISDSAPPRSHIFCEGRIAWSAEVRTDDLMNYTTFWIAFEAATPQESFKYVRVDVILDGEPLSEEMKFMQSAEPYSVTCTDSGRQFEAHRVEYTVFLPQLSPDEHAVVWNFAIAADLVNGGFDDPAELTKEYAITMNVEE